MEEQGKQQEIEIEEVTAQENVIAVRDLVRRWMTAWNGSQI